ncbi:MAG: hypothetical protein HC936_04850 [Leptolyngbyaceae cyanobacterium SU_3_3]|nr:hypothetical protein [Leptolyngbyaceae cyanobacterium SU_3_3]NJR50969.1 hypothetical protein [Leptolyngbyaceae cyanobacterium CSU_1_3]
MNFQSTQHDPLNSPHPIPWSWVMAHLNDSSQPQHYYRSHSLLSPDGQYKAYSRIQLYVEPEFYRSRVSSVLFLENLKTGDLQAITATSPFAENPFIGNSSELEGTISIVLPISWSEAGDRLLAREFESVFCSDIASDYALIWHRSSNSASTVAPTGIQFTNAILLGWSQEWCDRVLFRAGMMGEETWPLWVVDAEGETWATEDDRPSTHGQVLNSIWAGAQPQR